MSYDVHPVADLFLMLPDGELKELADDIAEHGLRYPIVVDTQGRILDGRNRLAACELAGVEPRYETYDGDDPAAIAYGTNVKRRKETVGSLALITAQYLIERGDRSNGRWRRGSLQDLAGINAGVGISQPRLAEAADVIEHAPDLIDGVKKGDSLKRAAEIARQRKADAEARDAKCARLREGAPDLLAFVEEQRHDLDEALALLERREERAAAEAAEAERLRQEQLAEEQREAERQRREHAEIITRRVARIEHFCDGWLEFIRLRDADHRDDVLDGLSDKDRRTVIEAERLICTEDSNG